MKPVLAFSVEEEEMLGGLGVKAIILFGSQAQGIARETSDFDFLILGEKQPGSYDRLYDLLAEKIDKLVDIDIVFAQDAPTELLVHTMRYGMPIYEEAPQVFADFKENVMLTTADFAPYQREFQRATLAHIAV